MVSETQAILTCANSGYLNTVVATVNKNHHADKLQQTVAAIKATTSTLAERINALHSGRRNRSPSRSASQKGWSGSRSSNSQQVEKRADTTNSSWYTAILKNKRDFPGALVRITGNPAPRYFTIYDLLSRKHCLVYTESIFSHPKIKD